MAKYQPSQRPHSRMAKRYRLRTNDFDRDLPPNMRILGQIDLAHAAATQQILELIASELLSPIA